MSRTKLHRTLTSTALALLVLAAPAAVQAASHPISSLSIQARAQLWLQGLWSWLGGPPGRGAERRPAVGTRTRRGSGPQSLPQADGSFIDPNGGKTPELPPLG